MTNTEVLTVEADSERGTITVQGRIFLGGVYDVDITLNKAACDDTYRVAFFTYENRAKPLYLGIVGGLGEDGKRGRISFSNGDLIDCYRPQSRVWNASIPIYAYLYQALPVDESGKAELPDYQQDGFADPIHIIAEGRFDLLWTPILGEKALANEKVIVAAVGPQGPTGEKGDKGRDGVNGTTYKPQLRRNADGDIFVDWLEKDKDGEYTVVAYEGRTNIKGDKGERGESSFEVAKNNGFLGDEQAWVYTVQNVPKNADRAEEAAKASKKSQEAVAEYVDATFPSKVTEAEKRLENATTSGVNSVTQRANQAVGALDQKQTQIISNIDGKAQAVNDALDTKLATANTAITEAVGKAETAKSDAVKAQGEASKSASEASTSASNASKSATQAKTSETNAKATADGLNAGLATLNGLNGRVTKIEDGKGVYKDSKGEISTFTPLSVGGENFKVMSYCLPLTKASPIDLEFAENSQGSLCSNGTHCFAADYLMTTRSANIRIYDANLNLLTSLVDTAGGNVAAGYKHATFEACFAIVDGYIYYAKLNRTTICKYDMSGELQTSAIVTAKPADKLRIFHNSITGHICVLKEDAYVPSGNRNCYIHVFDKDLNPIKNSDGTNKVIDISYAVSDIFGSHLGGSFACMKMWHIRGRVYICVPFGYGGDTKYQNVYLYTATEDDSIEPVRESIPVKDDNGFVVFETDTDGNPIVDDPTLEGSGVLRPKTTQGEILVFNAAVDTSRGTAYRCNPIFGKGRTSLGDAGQIYCMTDGVDTYMITADGRFVDLYRMQNWNAKDKTVLPVKYRDKRTGLTEKSAPNSGCSLYCIGSPTAIWGTTPLLCGLIWDSNGTMFGKDTRVVPMAVIDDKPRIAEYNTLTGVPIAFPGSLAGGAQNCAPVGAKWGFARYWFTTADAAVCGNG